MTFILNVKLSAPPPHFLYVFQGEMIVSKIVSYVWSLGSDNLPLFFIIVGVIMLAWVFFVGDMVLDFAS